MSDVDSKKLEKVLNDIVWTSLAGPTGDPDTSHCFAAAYAYKLLKELGLSVKGEAEVIELLTRDNIHDTDFLTGKRVKRD